MGSARIKGATVRLPRQLGVPCLGPLLALAGCGPADGGTGDGTDGADDDRPSAVDGSWVLVSGTVAGQDLRLEPTHPVTLRLAGDRAEGTSACNLYSATVSVTGDAIVFGPAGGTEMACFPRRVMDLEQRYLRALPTVDTAVVDAGQLSLTGPDVTLRFDPDAG